MDLELIIGAPDPGFFTKQGIKKGTALRFIHDIPKWFALQGNERPSEIAGAFSNDVLE
ncbi:uncharacterized protein BJX67DRAFT_367359 [Aspergillus lucknowensis]|uniref:Uncharacterized protein n=1 Tax=Aspergillus lucknowensis TaxID=176173 RepID=A0ABR4LCD8_9EURO